MYYFRPGGNSRFGTRLGKSTSKKQWSQAHLAVVTQTLRRKPRTQRISPDIVIGERPRLQILEGGKNLGTSSSSLLTQDVDVSIRFDSSLRLFSVSVRKDGVTLETRLGKRSQKVALTLGFVSIEGRKIRVPWKRIESGKVWQKTIEMQSAWLVI